MNNSQISTTHYMPFLGNDVYAVETPRYVPDSKGTEKTEREHITSIQSIKFFNPDNLIIESAARRIHKPSKILEEMQDKSNGRLLDILNNFQDTSSDRNKASIFGSLSKVHEVKSSTREFQSFQQRIKSNESTEYIREKHYLESCLNNLRGTRNK